MEKINYCFDISLYLIKIQVIYITDCLNRSVNNLQKFENLVKFKHITMSLYLNCALPINRSCEPLYKLLLLLLYMQHIRTFFNVKISKRSGGLNNQLSFQCHRHV